MTWIQRFYLLVYQYLLYLISLFNWLKNTCLSYQSHNHGTQHYITFTYSRDPYPSFTCDPLFFLGGSGFFLGGYECLGPLFLTFLYSFQLLFLKFKSEQYIKWEQCSWYLFFLFLFSLHNSLHKSLTLLLIWIFCKIPYIFNNEIWECFYQNR